MNIGLAIDKKNGVESPVIDTGKSGVSSRAYQSLETTTAGKYEIKEAQNQWQGWGTALKPSFEPIIVARKPFKGSLVDNVIEYGVGGINIDECRVGNGTGNAKLKYEPNNKNNVYGKGLGGGKYENTNGRFPANTILTYDESDFDEVCGGFPQNQKPAGNKKAVNYDNKDYNNSSYKINYTHNPKIAGDNGGSASRYFMNCKYTEKDEEFRRYIYAPKASKKDRDDGLDNFEIKGAKELLNREENSDGANWNGKYSSGNAYAGAGCPKKNTHPTVKPTELMQYLVRLVTPKDGTILDPFMGSGSTGKAVMYENKERNANYKFIGIEREKEYCDIAEARIKYASKFKEEQKEKDNQITFDDLK